MAPGSLVVVRGVNFTGGEAYAAEGFPLPASLGGVSVQFDGLQARLLSVEPQRIETQAPSLLGMEALEAGGTAVATVVVETAEGGSYPRRFTVAAHAPGVFTASGAGTGQRRRCWRAWVRSRRRAPRAGKAGRRGAGTCWRFTPRGWGRCIRRRPTG